MARLAGWGTILAGFKEQQVAGFGLREIRNWGTDLFLGRGGSGELDPELAKDVLR
jgi:hypothetical protein